MYIFAALQALIIHLVLWPYLESRFLEKIKQIAPELYSSVRPPKPLSLRNLVFESRWSVYRIELLKFCWSKPLSSFTDPDLLRLCRLIRIYQAIVAPISILILLIIFLYGINTDFKEYFF